ncbi:MAG: restriction endonuclease subunit S [Calditrichaceae bacterium]
MNIETKKLNDIAEVIISNVDKKSKPDETPIILCNYTDVYYNQFIRSNMLFMSATANDREIEKCALFNGDVVITKDSEKHDDIGVPAYIYEDIENLVCGYHLVILRPKPEKIYGLYLYYVLNINESKFQFHAKANGITRFGLRKADIESVEIPVPPFNEQQKIANILRALDDKIYLNRQINQTLEEIARAIFKSWFVDFDPVRAKMAAKENGQDPERAAMMAISGKTEEAFERLSAEQKTSLAATAALFPDAMQDSELGEIPRGWEVSQIGKEVDIFGGGTPSTKNKEFWEGGIYDWTTPKDLSGRTDKIIFNTSRKITEEGLKQISSGLLPKNTVLMSSRAPVGYLAIAKIPIAINQGYIAMVCKKRLTHDYILQWTNSNMDEIKLRAGGTTFAEISKKNFRGIPIIVPKLQVVNTYSRIVSNFYDLIFENLKTVEQLSLIRDTLLPKLLSGELRIPDAEQIAREAGV